MSKRFIDQRLLGVVLWFFSVYSSGTGANEMWEYQASPGLCLANRSEVMSSGFDQSIFDQDRTGFSVQAFFQPEIKDQSGGTFSWVGYLHALFIDEKGHLREDSNGNKRLDGYSDDYIIEPRSDASPGNLTFQRYSSPDNGVTAVPVGGVLTMNQFSPIWDARKELMTLENPADQRIYGRASGVGRYMFTWLDHDRDGEVDSGEELPFVPSTFEGEKGGYLGEEDEEKLVNYIRGVDSAGYRTRTGQFQGGSGSQVWRLGDIVHSRPVTVAQPEGYYSDTRTYNASDSTFLTFQHQYKDRRQVVYVGGNDGLIHAFNAGFWDSNEQKVTLSLNGETPHSLGAELWAYAPMNLLPHLRWLSRNEYDHVYFMDGAPLVFDANIFPHSDIYPGGWGTVAVVGMRLGGGPVDISVGGERQEMSSAYVVMDITNPELPPRVIAEITHPKMGFTTGRPGVIQRRLPDDSGRYSDTNENKWYLVLGSGPQNSEEESYRQALEFGTSDENLQLFVYDLNSRRLVSGFAPYDTGIKKAHTGDMAVVDWDQDHYDDAVYFGSVETSGYTCKETTVYDYLGRELYSKAGFSTSRSGGGSVSLSGNSLRVLAIARQGWTIDRGPQVSLTQAVSGLLEIEKGETIVFQYSGNLFEEHHSYNPYISYDILDESYRVVYQKVFARGENRNLSSRVETYKIQRAGKYRLRFKAHANIGDGWGSYSAANLYISGIRLDDQEGKPATRAICSGLGGRLLKLDLSDGSVDRWKVSTLVEAGRPISVAPVSVTNDQNERWLITGTGRDLTAYDNSELAQEYFIGVKDTVLSTGIEPRNNPVSIDDLLDTTDITIKADGDFIQSYRVGPGVSVSSFDGLTSTMKHHVGWVNRLTYNGINPSGKLIRSPQRSSGLILLQEYMPPIENKFNCLQNGNSALHVLFYQTGTAIPASLQRGLTAGTITDSTLSVKKIGLGSGRSVGPVIHQGGDGQTRIFAPGEGGRIAVELSTSDSEKGRQSWRNIPIVPRAKAIKTGKAESDD